MDKDMKETKQKLTDAIENVESVLKQLMEKMSNDDAKKYDDGQIKEAKKAVENAMKSDVASLVLTQGLDKGAKATDSLVAVRGTRVHVLAMLATLVLEVVRNIDTTPEEFAEIFLEGCKKCNAEEK